jgi:hypothetical protein
MIDWVADYYLKNIGDQSWVVNFRVESPDFNCCLV